MNIHSLILAVCVVMLSACSMFVEVKKGTPKQLATGTLCPVYHPMDPLPIPPLPNLSVYDNLDSDSLNLIQADYIGDLRQFIETERLQRQQHYQRYLKRCGQ